MSFWRYLFPQSKEVTPNTFWVHESEFEEALNPFDDTFVTYKVLEVKNGFVKYEYRSRKSFEPYLTGSSTLQHFYGFKRKINKPDWFS